MAEAVDIAVCSECGEEYEVEAKAGNLSIPLPPGVEVPLVCRECYLKMREVPVQQQVRPFDPISDHEKILKALDELGVNPNHHGRLSLKELDLEVYQVGQRYVEDVLTAGRWGQVYGLYIHGPPGTGKSQMAVSIIRALLETGTFRTRDIVYDRARAMVTQLQDRYKSGNVDEFSEVRRRAKLWIYEDAGTEKHTPDAFRVMEDIFDRRESRPTIVTSNLARGDLAKRWSGFDMEDRFTSRLRAYQAFMLDDVTHRAQR